MIIISVIALLQFKSFSEYYFWILLLCDAFCTMLCGYDCIERGWQRNYGEDDVLFRDKRSADSTELSLSDSYLELCTVVCCLCTVVCCLCTVVCCLYTVVWSPMFCRRWSRGAEREPPASPLLHTARRTGARHDGSLLLLLPHPHHHVTWRHAREWRHVRGPGGVRQGSADRGDDGPAQHQLGGVWGYQHDGEWELRGLQQRWSA